MRLYKNNFDYTQSSINVQTHRFKVSYLSRLLQNPHQTARKFWSSDRSDHLKWRDESQSGGILGGICATIQTNKEETQGEPSSRTCTFQKINVSNLIYVLKISVHRFSSQSTNLYKIHQFPFHHLLTQSSSIYIAQYIQSSLTTFLKMT